MKLIFRVIVFLLLLESTLFCLSPTNGIISLKQSIEIATENRNKIGMYIKRHDITKTVKFKNNDIYISYHIKDFKTKKRFVLFDIYIRKIKLTDLFIIHSINDYTNLAIFFQRFFVDSLIELEKFNFLFNLVSNFHYDKKYLQTIDKIKFFGFNVERTKSFFNINSKLMISA